MNYCVITGASKGIGEAMAQICASKGRNLILVARSKDMLEKQAIFLEEKYKVSVEVFSCDLGIEESILNLYTFTEGKGIDVSCLINNAGLGSCGAFVETDLARLRLQMRVNMEALTGLIHMYLPKMIEKKEGQILNIASTAAFQPGPYMSVYFATKAYVLSLSEGIRHEIRGTGVSITTHCPGPTASAFAEDAGNDKTMLFSMGAVATSREVAEHAYRAMERGKPVAVHGWSNWLGTILVPFVPRWCTQRLAAFLNLPRGE
jgi:short-subunit dehydrogenase